MAGSHAQVAVVSDPSAGALAKVDVPAELRSGRQDARRPHRQDACATKNFVINCQHDPRDRVAGDVAHQRDDRLSCGSTEQF